MDSPQIIAMAGAIATVATQESKDKEIMNIVKAIGITILPYNGYQSVVQMSEETKDVSDIPKYCIIKAAWYF